MQSTSLALVVLAALVTPAAAEAIHGDIEIDPTAYALAGNSIHAGVGYRHLRLDLGNFGLDLPQFVHGADGFDVGFTGYGVKLQYFRTGDQRGWYAGVDANVTRVHIRRQGTELGADDRQFGVGVHAGYRFALPAGFYVTPWLGIGYELGARDVMLDGKTYQAQSFTVFPAVHLGYRFQ
jgi:hypothetical protein